jgi:hypothetical protein
MGLCLVSGKNFGFAVVDFSQGFGFAVVEWVAFPWVLVYTYFYAIHFFSVHYGFDEHDFLKLVVVYRNFL